jgi:MFS family permease
MIPHYAPVRHRAGILTARRGRVGKHRAAPVAVHEPNPVRRIFVIALVDSTGTGLYLAGGVLFFTRALDVSATQIGLGLALAAACGVLTMYPIGRIADRLGPKRVLVILLLWRAAGMAGFAVTDGMTGFLILAILLGVAERADSPIMQAVVGAAVGPARRVRTMAIYNATRNLGFTLGVLLTTPVLRADTAGSYRWIMVGDAVTFLIGAALVRTLPLAEKPQVSTAQRKLLSGFTEVVTNRPFVALSALNGVLSLHMTILSVGVPLWIADHTDAPTAAVAPLLGINTVLAMSLQVRFSRGAETLTGAATAARRGGLALACAAVLLGLGAHISMPVVVVVLGIAIIAHTAGEMWHSASAWGLSFELSPAASRASYLSFFALGAAVQGIVGPPIVTTVADVGLAGWLVLTVVILAAGLAVPVVTRYAQRHQPPEPEPEPKRSAAAWPADATPTASTPTGSAMTVDAGNLTRI